MANEGFWPDGYWPDDYWADGYWGGTAVPTEKYTPTLVLSDAQLVGSWRIDQMTLSQPTASLRLKEDRGTRNIKLPKRNFTVELYPNAAANTIGKPIPCLIGKGRSLTAYLIDTTTSRFKIVDHGLVTFDAFRDESGNPYTPDTLFLSSGEFIFTGWDGESELFADVTATGANPVDAVAVILTDTERGASLPSSRLDTTSTGKGFGSSGARLKYVRGEIVRTGGEALDFSIGLYMNEVKTVEEWIRQISAASFSTVFVNRLRVWQIKAWQPIPSVDLDEIRTIVGKPKYTWKMDSPVTRVVAKYAKQHGIDNVQAFEYKDDWLRQLRNLSEHASKEPDALPLSDRFSAKYWAQRTVATRGVPRRVISFQTTQEHKELEIGDFFRLIDDDLNLDTVFEAITVSTAVGDNPVDVMAIDVRGFGDTSGFWVGDSDPAWDDSWTDAEVIERRENSGFWTNDGGYADTDDPLRSWYNSRWV